MKTLKNTFAILFLTILTFSCSNNDDAPAPPAQNQPPGSDYFLEQT